MSQELWGSNIGRGEKGSEKSKKELYSDGFTDQGKLGHVMVDGRGQMFYLSSH